MAISRAPYSKKAPSQKPTDFYKGVQQGGTDGKPQSVPDKLEGGPMREKIMGNPALSKQ